MGRGRPLMGRNALVVQAILIAVCAAVFFASRDAENGLSALFGGGIAVLNVQLLRWRTGQVQVRRGLSAGQSLVTFYRSALERYLVVIGLLALGMGWIELPPLPLVVGFVAGQVATLLLWSEDHALRDRSKDG